MQTANLPKSTRTSPQHPPGTVTSREAVIRAPAAAFGLVEQKDVVLGLLGACAAALVLVFLGLLVTGASSAKEGDPDGRRVPYRIVGGLALGTFLLGMRSSGVSAWRLVGPQNGALPLDMNDSDT